MATYSNPIATRLHRRAGEQGIAYNLLDDHGLTAEVFRMVRHADGSYSLPVLGTVHGGDPMNTYINAALEFTEHDAELFSLIARDIEDRENQIHTLYRNALKQIESLVDMFADSVAVLRRRYV